MLKRRRVLFPHLLGKDGIFNELELSISSKAVRVATWLLLVWKDSTSSTLAASSMQKDVKDSKKDGKEEAMGIGPHASRGRVCKGT